jgi:hypothetical protein
MGKLRTSLTSTSTLLNALDHSVKEKLGKLRVMLSDSDAWMKSGLSGCEHLYFYVAEKLKSKKVEWKTVENQPLSAYDDPNVQEHLKAIDHCVAESVKFSQQWTLIKTGLEGDLKRAEDALADSAAQLAKKKKKLFQSKKYKTKMDHYEAVVRELTDKAHAINQKFRDLKALDLEPKSPARIHSTVHLKITSPLKELAPFLTRRKDEHYQEFVGAKTKLDKTANDIRAAAEFASQMKVIQEMVAESEAMEAEAGED